MKILFTIRSLTGGGAETILFLKRYRYMKCHNERIVQ